MKQIGLGKYEGDPRGTPAWSVFTAGAPKDCQPSPAMLCDLSTKSVARRWVSASPMILVVLVSVGGGVKIDALTSFKSTVAWGHPELFKNINSVRCAAWFRRPPRKCGGRTSPWEKGLLRTTPDEEGS